MPATFADIATANTELKLQEVRNKLSEAKAKESVPATPAGLPSPEVPSMPPALAPEHASKTPVEDEKVQLVALYGIGSRISAEIRYKGWTQTVVSGSSNVRIGPWLVESITQNQVNLVREVSKAKLRGKSKKLQEAVVERKELYYAAETPDPTSSPNPMQGYGAPGIVTPIMPSFGPAPSTRMPMPPIPQARSK